MLSKCLLADWLELKFALYFADTCVCNSIQLFAVFTRSAKCDKLTLCCHYGLMRWLGHVYVNMEAIHLNTRSDPV